MSHYLTLRNFLISSIIIGLLASMSVLFRRITYELNNTRVDLCVSFRELNKMALMGGQTFESVLPRLQKEGGITSIALEEDTIADLVDAGQVTMVKGAEINNIARGGGASAIGKRDNIKDDAFYLSIRDAELYARIKDFLDISLGETNVREVGQSILEVRDDREDLEKMGLGVSASLSATLSGYGFDVIPRLKNSYRVTDALIKSKIDSVSRIANVQTIIFEGDTVLGFPTKLSKLASMMNDANLNIGDVEFADQLGRGEITAKMPRQVIRVHSIPEMEMPSVTRKKALDRYMRAAKDRGVRLLFLHPYFQYSTDQNIVDYNISYFSDIYKSLGKFGMSNSSSRNLLINRFVTIKLWELFFISLGVTAGLIYLIQWFFPIGMKWILVLVSANFLCLIIALVQSARMFNWMQFVALGSAIIFPSLALISQFPDQIAAEQAKRHWYLVMLFLLKVVGITFIGAIFISAALTDIPFMLGIRQFMGVKLAFIVPPILIGLYFYLQPQRITSMYYVFRRLLYAPVRTGTLLAIFLCVGMVLIYIIRSGNHPGMKVPAAESWLRNTLEQLLIVRPRTKEFLIGYPILILSWLFAGTRITRNWIWFFIVMGSVALISMLNSFCHVYTPFLLSMYRGFLGLVLGSIVGLCAYGFFLGIAYIKKQNHEHR